jgi:ankyrin repeat protein
MSSQYLFDLILENNITELQNTINASNVNTTSPMNITLLMYAICYNKYDVVNLLLQNNADTTLKDNKNLTVLEYSIRHTLKTKNKDILELLINNNPSITSKDLTASILSIQNRNVIYKDIFNLVSS